MYFRTKKNNYNIDIIVAIESDATLVNTTGNQWLESNDPDCVPGAYWVDGQCVVVGSDDYDELVGAKIAAAREDADAAQRVVDEAALAALVAERERIAELQAEEEDDDETAELNLEERKTAAKTLPAPVYIPIRKRPEGIPTIDAENLAVWEEIVADTARTIDGVINDTDPDTGIVRFPEPITYLEGTPEEHTVEFIVLADEDKASYLDHWRIVEADQQAWVAHMKTVLGV